MIVCLLAVPVPVYDSLRIEIANLMKNLWQLLAKKKDEILVMTGVFMKLGRIYGAQTN